MELEPKTETGIYLNKILENWQNDPLQAAAAIDKLKRVFLLFSSKIINPITFLDALYGQSVLAEPANMDLMHEKPIHLRIRHAVGISCDQLHLKELVVALEWSENEAILTEILKWAESTAKKDFQKKEMTASPVDLAPHRSGRPFSSLFSAAHAPTVKSREQREKEITWDEEKSLTVLEVCGSKIIIGWDSGQIQIFSSVDLQCETALPYHNQIASVTSFQCTCTEIIAGYDDGYICVWNISNGLLTMAFRLGGKDTDYATCMRWREPKLVVGKSNGVIGIWQIVNSVRTILGSWKSGFSYVKRVDFNADYVIVLGYGSTDVNIHFLNGKLARTISNEVDTKEMGFAFCSLANVVITGGDDRILRIWDVATGECLRELQGHKDGIIAVDSGNSCILSADTAGEIIIWSIGEALDFRPAGIAGITAPDLRSRGLEYDYPLRLGRNFFVRHDGSSSRISVLDLL